MSRRHSSSRRRNYGRRQHEVRERRTSPLDRVDLDGRAHGGDWRLSDLDDDTQHHGLGDSFGRTQP